MASRLSLFLAELKRRKVYHVAVVYVVVGWGVAQGAEYLFGDLLGLDPVIWQVVAGLVVLGFPIALVLAWAYEIRPEEPRTVEQTRRPVGETPESEQRKSIVVLPFDNMSPDPGDAYFADGLTEEIITHLAYIHSLRVISRNSAMVLKGTQKSTGQIAEELKVQYVLEGSVRKAGDDLRITSQLIDAENDAHVWAEKYDGVLEDVFGMQEDVARSIVAALRLELSPDEEERLAERPIEDLGAYECYLRARNEIDAYTVEGALRAIQHLEAAKDIIGENPLLFSGLAYAFYQQANLGMAQDEAISRAFEYVEKALDLDPASPHARAIKGLLEFTFRGRPQEAVVLFKRALETNPNEPLALMYLVGVSVMMAGKNAFAQTVFDRLVKVDPLGPMTFWLRGALPFFRGDFHEATLEWRQLPEEMSNSPIGKAWTAPAVAYSGDREGALKVLAHPELPTGKDAGSHLCRIQWHALQGDREGALGDISDEFRKTAIRDGAWSWLIAAPLAYVGAVDEAVEWLESAVRRGGFINYPMLAEHDPFLAKLHPNLRYHGILEEAKQAWEAFEV